MRSSIQDINPRTWLHKKKWKERDASQSLGVCMCSDEHALARMAMTQREWPLNEVSFISERNGGGCTSLTLMPLAALSHKRRAERGARATPRAEVTKAHARGMKMDGNLFTGGFILAHTRQNQPPRPSPALFFALRRQRQCPMTKESDVYGY